MTTPEPGSLPSCDQVKAGYCAEHAGEIASICGEMDFPPGRPVISRVGDRRCYCRCGEQSDADPADTSVASTTSTTETPQTAAEGDAEWLARTLADQLGLNDRPSSAAVVAAAIHPPYHRQLIMAREEPTVLARLLASPPRVSAAAALTLGFTPDSPAGDPAGAQETGHHDAGTLLRRATAAAVRWGASGFALADEPTRERRLAACAACPHRADPPNSGAHRVTSLLKPASTICGLCGCVTDLKVRLASEACPAADPADPKLTRWGEPREIPDAPVRPAGKPVAAPR